MLLQPFVSISTVRIMSASVMRAGGASKPKNYSLRLVVVPVSFRVFSIEVIASSLLTTATGIWDFSGLFDCRLSIAGPQIRTENL
jgi:hypothetical protein